MELVKRYCECGCKKTWMAYPTSQSIYFSVTHMPPKVYAYYKGLSRAKFLNKRSAQGYDNKACVFMQIRINEKNINDLVL